MSEQLPIKIERCSVSRVGASFQDDLTVSEWMAIGKQLNAIGSCYQFLLGDWLNFGERQYGNKYTAAIAETGLDIQTLTNYSWVCSKVEISRRREILSYSHHLEVAPLSVKDQDLWLEKSEANNWSVSDLRAAIRKSGAQHSNEEHGKEEKTWFGYLLKVVRGINQAGVEQWNTMQKAQYKEALKPLVDIYERL